MDRRSFIKLSSLAGASVAVSTGLAGCTVSPSANSQPQTNATFTHGVASGDPLKDAVIIWTRAVPTSNLGSGSGSKSGLAKADILWEMASDADFANVISSGIVEAKAIHDFTVKVDVAGLSPARRYFYRFKSANNTSPVGETRTLPEVEVSNVTFGIFSCSNYPAGFFTPYMEAAKDDNIDYVLHLGDYIYEYDGEGYATEHAKEIGRTYAPDNDTELYTLTDYRNRYALYRTDSGLLSLHQNKPFIVVWDDHEITNDTYKDGAENHQEDEGDFYERRAAAVQAYYEWLPIRPPFGTERLEIYRQFTFGKLLDLYMLDTRVLARDKQLEYANYRDAETKAFDQARFMKDISNPNRGLLGETQRNWLHSSMRQSQAKWQVLGQQLLIGRMLFPVSIFNGVERKAIPDHVHRLANIKRKQKQGGALSEQELALINTVMPYNLDAWDGYPVEREQVLMQLKSIGKPVIALAGDTHNAWHNKLTLKDGTEVGVELATPGVTSPGMEHYLSMGDEKAKTLADDLPLLIEDLQYCNLHQRGFMTLTVSQDSAKATWHYVDAILTKAGKVVNTHSYEIKA
ncbi:alkaline phosphatase D family protein [Alteromonas macleodii]|uniref:Tat (Twin-arginine translocation) pathway signal sequence domain protein n=1 Tax=Alteromonas macleodii TaxID=28108 RepID=A0AB36FU60_ALTMA|nr:alkaline phosphatase D family protein [Alteromonas macleodii]OES26958.1 tat (twin-arginine translocation) pathway signal sequence domain protein [Alteromonas macleodii]OES27454.1 tat (twin-arginine translocation) pathway signal sequence domain protein [Alteromonas macleodii]OES27672.1 tat (twin-arginine translocation) pathway signal sequence domain protein [Alteromonas macleodii]OES39638.1 tat (twin-arginine translocation) pathway signal sequence domain protein [Alteromonas macleodii]OZC007